MIATTAIALYELWAICALVAFVVLWAICGIYRAAQHDKRRGRRKGGRMTLGDIAEMIEQGALCHECGMEIDDEADGFAGACGYPRCCRHCSGKGSEPRSETAAR